MKKLIYITIQCTWGILQNVVGGLLFLLNIRHRHFFFKGAVATYWSCDYSLGCGMFIFLSDHYASNLSNAYNRKLHDDLLAHEYGHTLQSIVLGPLFLPVIGLPSLVWAACFQKWRQRNNVSYYGLYCEKWANIWGDKVCGNVRRQNKK